MLNLLASTIGALLLTLPPTTAGSSGDETSVIHLRDGSALVGTVRFEGETAKIRIDGVPERPVAAADVLAVVDRESARRECARLLEQTPARDGFRCLQVVRLAVRARLLEEALRASDAALEAGVDRARVGESLLPMASEVLAGAEGPALLSRARFVLDGLAARSTPARQLHAALALASAGDDSWHPELERGLRSASPATRRVSAEVLGMVAPEAKSQSLVNAVLYDRDPEVRAAATRAIEETRDPRVFGRVVGALGEKSTLLRMHSAEALGTLGRIEAVPALVRRLDFLLQSSAGSTAPRAFLFVGEQRAYVGGYSVEVAQASSIAEPQISILQSGVVLDARILNVSHEQVVRQEISVVRNALAKIAGSDVGPKPADWVAWYNRTVTAGRKPEPKTGS